MIEVDQPVDGKAGIPHAARAANVTIDIIEQPRGSNGLQVWRIGSRNHERGQTSPRVAVQRHFAVRPGLLHDPLFDHIITILPVLPPNRVDGTSRGTCAAQGRANGDIAVAKVAWRLRNGRAGIALHLQNRRPEARWALPFLRLGETARIADRERNLHSIGHRGKRVFMAEIQLVTTRRRSASTL